MSESLGKWPSVASDNDYLIDTSCYFLPKWVAVKTSPIWYRRTREPGFLDPDRALAMFLRAQNLSYETTARYSLNYRTGSREFSVRKEFFLHGNERMLKKHRGNLPWKAPRPAAKTPASPQVKVTWSAS